MRAPPATGVLGGMNRHLSMTTTLAGVALASLAIVYGLVFYDGRSKAERINDCAKKAGYATTVTVDPGHNGSWSDMSGNFAAPTFTPPRLPRPQPSPCMHRQPIHRSSRDHKTTMSGGCG